MDKKMIRALIIQKLKEITEIDREQKSKEIIKKLFLSNVFKNANIVATTMPMEHEVNTRYLIQECWNENKTVVVPKCIHKTREMDFYKIKSFSDLEKGYFGILEPKVNLCEKINKTDIELIVVPGVAFTNKGERIGYGGGYFDRYLQDYEKNFLSLAFDCQIVDDLPTEKHDFVIPFIYTETNTYKC